MELRSRRFRRGRFRGRRDRAPRPRRPHLHRPGVRQHPADLLCASAAQRRAVSRFAVRRGRHAPPAAKRELHVPLDAGGDQQTPYGALSAVGIDVGARRSGDARRRLPHHVLGYRVRRHGDQSHRPRKERPFHRGDDPQGLPLSGACGGGQSVDAQGVRRRLSAARRFAAVVPPQTGQGASLCPICPKGCSPNISS